MKKWWRRHRREEWLGGVLLAVLVVTVAWLRAWFVSDHHFIFLYDQARDAIYARRIAHGDLMIFGPTASGTRDTVMHGVVWYYFLAPFYALTSDPQLAATALAVLSGLWLVSYYWVSRQILGSTNGGLIVAGLMGFSSLASVNSTWISNPSLTYFFLPWYIYFVWSYSQTGRRRDCLWAGITLGLLTQAAIFQAYWGLLLVWSWWRTWDRKRTRRVWLDVTSAGLGWILAVSTMLVSEFLLIKRGILTLQVLKEFSVAPIKDTLSVALSQLIDVYATALARSILPQYLVLGLLLIVGSICLWLRSRSPRREFVSAILLTPLVFLSLVFRHNTHLVAGVEFGLYLLIADLIGQRGRLWSRDGMIIAAIIFVIGNVFELGRLHRDSLHYVSTQKGVHLRDQLTALDQMYQLADGEDFSFSANTNPAGIDVTWHYLFSWYGQDRYGYTPTFIGPTQAGYSHYGLLRESQNYRQTTPYHFYIVEPQTGLDIYLEKQLFSEQERLMGTISGQLQFGSMTVYY